MTDDTQRWIATTADGREVVIEVRGTNAEWRELDGRRCEALGVFDPLLHATRSIQRDYECVIVEVRRFGEPSRAQLLAAVAAARAYREAQTEQYVACALDRLPDAGERERVADARRALDTALAALPKTRS